MRFSRRLMVVGVLTLIMGLLAGPSASSKKATPVPDGERWTVLEPGDATFSTDEHFYLQHGYGPENLAGLDAKDFSVHVFMDGHEIAPDSVGCTLEESKKETCDKMFIWDFPAGSLSAGTYEVAVRWIAPCRAWVGEDLNQYGVETVVESCLDDDALMTNLYGEHELTIADSAETCWTDEYEPNDAPYGYALDAVSEDAPLQLTATRCSQNDDYYTISVVELSGGFCVPGTDESFSLRIDLEVGDFTDLLAFGLYAIPIAAELDAAFINAQSSGSLETTWQGLCGVDDSRDFLFRATGSEGETSESDNTYQAAITVTKE